MNAQHAIVGLRGRDLFSTLRSLALLSPSGKILNDSASDSHDADYLAELVRRSRAQAHYFSNADDGSVVHLLLHQASGSTRGYWALRLTPTFFDSLTKQGETGIRPLWLVENRVNHQIISREESLSSAKPGVLSPDDLANTVLTVPLNAANGHQSYGWGSVTSRGGTLSIVVRDKAALTISRSKGISVAVRVHRIAVSIR